MKQKCPLVKGKCWEHGCVFYTNLLGMNPQTGEQQNQWGCAVAWLPILLIENAGQMRKVQASTDKVATETRGVQDFFKRAIGQARIEKDLNGTKALTHESPGE